MIIIRRVRRNTTIIALKKHWNAILGYIYMIMILSSTLKRTQSNNRYITKALSQFLTVVWSSTYFPVPTLYDILYIYRKRERDVLICHLAWPLFGEQFLRRTKCKVTWHITWSRLISRDELVIEEYTVSKYLMWAEG